jgi:hypothetical protein
MTQIKQALRLVLSDLSGLSKPAVALSAAGIIAPIVAAIAGVDVTAAELAADLAVAGGIAATLQKLNIVKAPAPAPVPAPVKAGK